MNRPNTCPLCNGPAAFYPPYDTKSGSPRTAEGWDCPDEGGRFEISLQALELLEARPVAATRLRAFVRDERARGVKIPFIQAAAVEYAALRRDDG
jgi:hypothetical protein